MHSLNLVHFLPVSLHQGEAETLALELRRQKQSHEREVTELREELNRLHSETKEQQAEQV